MNKKIPIMLPKIWGICGGKVSDVSKMETKTILRENVIL